MNTFVNTNSTDQRVKAHHSLKRPHSLALPTNTFVLCVESGPLEEQTCRAIESIRRWGGRYSECPVLAVTPRRGPALSKETKAFFDRWGVDHLSFHADHSFGWYGPMNKPAALAEAEKQVTTNQVTWLDSDILVIGEPHWLALNAHCEFAAAPSSYRFDVASDGTNEHEGYWQAVSRKLGIDLADYPFISAQEGESGLVRMYWQGGVFTYKTETKLGALHYENSLEIVRGRVASSLSGPYFTEQLGLATAVFQRRLRHRVLTASHNFPLNPLTEKEQAPDQTSLPEARIVHYYGSMWPDSFGRFVEILGHDFPEVASWLHEIGPLGDSRTLPSRLKAKLIRSLRKHRANRFRRSCSNY